jgi:hypothetical protein
MLIVTALLRVSGPSFVVLLVLCTQDTLCDTPFQSVFPLSTFTSLTLLPSSLSFTAAFSMKKAKLEVPEPSDAHAAPAPAPRKMAPAKYKKAPDAPKRFKSAFIIFSAEKHKEIKEDLTKQGRAEKVRSYRRSKMNSRLMNEWMKFNHSFTSNARISNDVSEA